MAVRVNDAMDALQTALNTISGIAVVVRGRFNLRPSLVPAAFLVPSTLTRSSGSEWELAVELGLIAGAESVQADEEVGALIAEIDAVLNPTTINASAGGNVDAPTWSYVYTARGGVAALAGAIGAITVTFTGALKSS